ncbi:hypothetical protein [Oceanirhabdus seepicola]|uniref:Uncharacterized protein n=1 Tax=Oceanirhabdus seepicola TaxID=2828781 RepID=A0A9J6NZ62_9CLOT|nr:hypothetical protein [Oceanirhabdus seepicola]MCM1988893.1 hypothetical protein [Oceanirhabdus seepicola]
MLRLGKKDFKIYMSFLGLIILLSIIYPVKAFADIGPKPTITILVTGYEDRDYLLDLLSNEEMDRLKDKPTDEKELDLYNYNEDGWKALNVRTGWVSGSLKGEYNSESEKMIHNFGYRPPETFRIIVRKNNGDIVVSNEVTPNQFDAIVTFNLKSGKAEVVKKNIIGKMRDISKEHHFLPLVLLIILVPIVFTIIIEIIIALFFKIKELKVLFWTNILTQILLQITFRGVIDSRYNYYFTLFLLEMGVFLIEYLIYRKTIKSINQKRILLYTLIANGITYVVGLFVFGMY